VKRHPMTPVEFDAACRLLVRECPWLWETSGYRGVAHNEDVGGVPGSKHVLGIARDFCAKDQAGLDQGGEVALRLGLWILVHDVGSGNHLHCQGLPVGPVPRWWMNKYQVGG